MPIYDCKVVSINRSRTSRDSTRWPLGKIILIHSHTALGRYARTCHFKQIELGSYLKKRTGIRFVGVQMLDVGNYFAYRHLSDFMSTRMYTFSQFGQRRDFQLATNQYLSVYARTVNSDILANLL